MEIIVSLIAPVFTALISYLGARYQSNKELQTAREQQKAELQQLKESQDAEIRKIKEQSMHEIEKVQVEMKEQAELYEKNAQTDMISNTLSDVFSNALSGDLSGIENLNKMKEEIEKSGFKKDNAKK